jgi:hypothetical protein
MFWRGYPGDSSVQKLEIVQFSSESHQNLIHNEIVEKKSTSWTKTSSQPGKIFRTQLGQSVFITIITDNSYNNNCIFSLQHTSSSRTNITENSDHNQHHCIQQLQQTNYNITLHRPPNSEPQRRPSRLVLEPVTDSDAVLHRWPTSSSRGQEPEAHERRGPRGDGGQAAVAGRQDKVGEAAGRGHNNDF